MTIRRPTGLVRERRANHHARVTNVELFFDLVFVFAVTQLSHTLLKNLTVSGAVHTLVLFLAIWWVWIYTSWVTNWLDPAKTPVRLLLFVLMFAGLILSISIPEAFEAAGPAFAMAYVFMQVGRSAFTLWAFGAASPVNTLNFQRITSWLAFAGLFWLAGGFVHNDARLGFWAFAVGVEYAGPSLGFWTPGIGRSTAGDWDVEGAHLAERCALFVIIALGESLLVTGATFGELGWSLTSASGFVSAFVGSVALWWIYFDAAAEHGSARIAASSNPGQLARLVYTYVHLLIVAGVIVSAVGDELVLSHPLGHSEPHAVAVILGGPAIYLVGALLFKGAIRGRIPLSHIVGLSILALFSLFAFSLPPLGLGVGSTLILVLVAVWERVSLGAPRDATDS